MKMLLLLVSCLFFFLYADCQTAVNVDTIVCADATNPTDTANTAEAYMYVIDITVLTRSG